VPDQDWDTRPLYPARTRRGTREKKVLGLGPDSLVVLFTYIGDVVLHTCVPG